MSMHIHILYQVTIITHVSWHVEEDVHDVHALPISLTVSAECLCSSSHLR